MTNYVSFLHNFDCTLLYGGFSKLDVALIGNNISNLNQTNTVYSFTVTLNKLQP